MSVELTPGSDAPLANLPMLSLDLETTGLDVAADRIVQIGAFAMRGAHCDSHPTLDCFVDPGIPISLAATRIHGIVDADVSGAATFSACVDDLEKAIAGRIVVGHHIGFDLAVLRHEAARMKHEWRNPPALDVALIAAALEPGLPDHGMESVAVWLGITIADRHTATGDSRVAAEIFARLLPLLHARDIYTLGAARSLIASRNDLIQQELRAGWCHTPLMPTAHDTCTLQQQLDCWREQKNGQVEEARKDLDDGVTPLEVKARINSTNFSLHRKVLDLCLRESLVQGLGDPPVEFDAIIIGSGGRYESLLYPDQDNGFILADTTDTDFDAVDQWFAGLAEKMVDALATVGFYRCPGWVMATNPRWRKTLGGFKNQLSGWIDSARGDALHYCNIALDFSAFHGAGKLTESLHRFVVEKAASPRFLSRLHNIHKEHRGALGWFGRIHTDPNPGPNQGKIDLKTGGIMPIVTSVRLLALLHGVQRQTTIDRIQALSDRGVLEHADEVIAAYNHFVYLLLRQQIDDYQAGVTMGNHVPPQALNQTDRGQLVLALKVTRQFCDRVGKAVGQRG